MVGCSRTSDEYVVEALWEGARRREGIGVHGRDFMCNARKRLRQRLPFCTLRTHDGHHARLLRLWLLASVSALGTTFTTAAHPRDRTRPCYTSAHAHHRPEHAAHR